MATRISLVSTPGPMPQALPSNGPVPMTAAQAALARRVMTRRTSYTNGIALSESREEQMNGLGGLGELVQVVT